MVRAYKAQDTPNVVELIENIKYRQVNELCCGVQAPLIYEKSSHKNEIDGIKKISAARKILLVFFFAYLVSVACFFFYTQIEPAP